MSFNYNFSCALISLWFRFVFVWFVLLRYPKFLMDVVYVGFFYKGYCKGIRGWKSPEKICEDIVDWDTATPFNEAICVLHKKRQQNLVRTLLTLMTLPLTVIQGKDLLYFVSGNYDLQNSFKGTEIHLLYWLFAERTIAGCCGWYVLFCIVCDVYYGIRQDDEPFFTREQALGPYAKNSKDPMLPSVINNDTKTYLVHKGLDTKGLWSPRSQKSSASSSDSTAASSRKSSGVSTDLEDIGLPKHWFVFHGSVCGAFFYNGLMSWIYDRYGYEAFKKTSEPGCEGILTGWIGASSGGHVAGYAGAPIV